MPPRCVHLIPVTDDAGAENQARYLIAGLRDEGVVEPSIAYFAAGRGHAGFEGLGVPMCLVERRRRLLFDLLRRSRALARAYADDPPELLHTWLLEGNIVGLLAARRWPETRVVVTQRGGAIERSWPMHLRLERLLLGRAAHAISNSRDGLELMIELGMEPDRVSLIPNGVPEEQVAVHVERTDLRGRIGIPADAPLVAAVGRADTPGALEQKDFPTLVAGLAELRYERPDLRLLLIGPTRDQLAGAGLDLPDWATAVGWARTADHLNAADVLAISSRAEGHSNAAAEALMAGVPVVTTATGDHVTLVEASGGRVVPVGDAAGLGQAVGELLGDPPARDRVRSVARAHLSVEPLVRSTTDVYERLLDL